MDKFVNNSKKRTSNFVLQNFNLVYLCSENNLGANDWQMSVQVRLRKQGVTIILTKNVKSCSENL